MTTRLPHVLIAIVTHESEGVIEGCLRTLPDAVGGSATCVTVVVDNASTDGTTAVVRSVAPEAILHCLDHNAGYAAGINAAISRCLESTVDAILVLNPDVRLGAGALGPLLSALATPGTGIAVPRLVDGDGDLLPSLRREPTVLRAFGEALLGGRRAGRLPALGEQVVDVAAYTQETSTAWATGAAMLISRTCQDAVGPWDESYFLYSEETDFCLRARDAGYTVRFRPDAQGVHLGGESNTSDALWALLTRNRVRLYRSRHGRIRSSAFLAAVTLNEVVRAARGRATSRAALRALLPRSSASPPRSVEPAIDGYVCFSAQDWWYFNRGHSDFQLMSRVARERPVLLVNSLGMRLPRPGGTTAPWGRIARKVRSAARGLRTPIAEIPGFHVFTPVFLPVYGDGPMARVNNRAVLAQVRRTLRRIGVHNPAVVVTLPTAWPIARRLARGRTLVYRSDRYSALPEADEALVARLERDLLQAADVALFASTELWDREGPTTRRPVLLRHGVDIEQFRAADQLVSHPALAPIPHPRVGYVGTIDAYTVDLDLLERVARLHPSVQLVLAGPTDVDITSLLALENVHHFGVLPFDDVPSFLAGLDVALMPWRQNEWIRHCNPIKLAEYLAVGLPVVSTDFPEVRRFRHVIAVAKDADDFSTRVLAAVEGKSHSTPEQRRASVSSETWDAQAARLVSLAEHLTDPAARRPASAACAAS